MDFILTHSVFSSPTSGEFCCVATRVPLLLLSIPTQSPHIHHLAFPLFCFINPIIIPQLSSSPLFSLNSILSLCPFLFYPFIFLPSPGPSEALLSAHYMSSLRALTTDHSLLPIAQYGGKYNDKVFLKTGDWQSILYHYILNEEWFRFLLKITLLYESLFFHVFFLHLIFSLNFPVFVKITARHILVC